MADEEREDEQDPNAVGMFSRRADGNFREQVAAFTKSLRDCADVLDAVVASHDACGEPICLPLLEDLLVPLVAVSESADHNTQAIASLALTLRIQARQQQARLN